MAAQLTNLAVEPDFPGLSADVNVSGDGLVRLGTIRPEAALVLARLIVSGLGAEKEMDADALTVEAGSARRNSSAA
ncbi:hypothetical protein ACWEWG_22435 [Streptomyces sp. NPDC003758]|uniref:FXSXX-COOH protein n=1 Tax=Streptomyces cynarae TaxID=2981134 RepID=A0ABY6ED21_9ACTN|nr:hypothetical protein [Streptomyces cynarae]UXY21913.1 hypothetical protein N8I84_26845 [Streptomyces cynarae]